MQKKKDRKINAIDILVCAMDIVLMNVVLLTAIWVVNILNLYQEQQFYPSLGEMQKQVTRTILSPYEIHSSMYSCMYWVAPRFSVDNLKHQ